MDKNILREYAKLIAVSGVNVQPRQEVVVRAEPESLDFLETLVEELYLAGAGRVRVEWRYVPLTCLDIKYQDAETLGSVPKWEEEKLRHNSDTLPAMIYLRSDDPDGMNGIDQEKWALAQQARYKISKPYRDAMENKYQWCVVSVPGVKWARKVFPGLSDDEAVEKLWQAILECSRATDKPIETWNAHDENLLRRCNWLNSLDLRRLNYKSESTGTDFTVGLLPECQFMGGADKLPGTDVWFNANIPTEEVFTTPRAGDAEGIVYATKPLSYRGVLIENFSVRFENGRAVEVHAEKNEEALKLMIAMDEGACKLGECALVPYDSPINRSGILFYNTLFDENASCHLALGMGYSSCLKDFEKYTPDEARELGVNDSMIHEDFMIGSPDLRITGITADGREVPIFINGDWAE